MNRQSRHRAGAYRTVRNEFPTGASLRGGRKPLVVGIDGSGPSHHALEWAIGLAGDIEIELVAVHARACPRAAHPHRPVGRGRPIEKLVSDLWCAPLSRSNVAHRIIVCRLPVDRALVGVCRSERASRLVIGTDREVGDPHRGQLAARLAAHAPCSLLVVPTRPDEPFEPPISVGPVGPVGPGQA